MAAVTASASASSSSLSPPAQLRPRGSSFNNNASLSIEPISLGQLVQSQSEPASLVNKRSVMLRESLGPEPQTPGELVRKSTAPTTIVAPQQPLTLAVPQRQSSNGTTGTTDTLVSNGGSGSGASSSSGSASGHGNGRTRRSSIRRHHAFPSSSAGPSSRRIVVNSYEHEDDDDDDAASAAGMLTGGPHRPMLSVLLSLGVAALPPFARSKGPLAPGRRKSARRVHQHRLPRSAAGSRSVSVSGGTSRSASRRSSFSLEEHAPMPPSRPASPSPFSSHFYPAPPPTPSFRRTTPLTSAAVKQRKLASKSFYLPVLFLLTIFVFTLLPIALALYSLPLRSFFTSNSSDPSAHPPSFPPKTIADISALASSLRTYASSSSSARLHVLFVLSITAVWKHAWSIPGSVLVNVIAGSLYSAGGGGIALATLHMTLLTTVGSIAASGLSMPLAPLVRTFFPRALDVTRRALEGGSPSTPGGEVVYDEKTGMVKEDDTPTWVRLVVMRLVGVVPWSGINVACGVCGVSMWDCWVGTFIGTLPWTAVTCQVGDILQTLSSAASSSASSGSEPQTLGSVLTSPGIIIKLTLLSALSLGPVLYRDKLRAVLGGSSSGASTPAGGVSTPVAIPMSEQASVASGSTMFDSLPQLLATENGSGVDEAHLLPLSYTSTPTPATAVFSIPKTRSSSSEASSTVGDDLEAEHDAELEVGYGSDELDEKSERGRTRVSRRSMESKRWSMPWTMWGAEKGGLERGEERVELMATA